MFNRNLFSKNFKLVRSTYKFTIVELAETFGLVSKTTVGAWEKGTNIPSTDILADLSTFFGISIDWFAGISRIPYTPDSIENAENYVFKKLMEVDKNSTYKFFYPSEYLNIDTRKELYSLSVRANIIVLSHYAYIPWKDEELNYKPKPISKFRNAVKYRTNLIMDHLYPTVHGASKHKKIFAIENLDKLLKRETSAPIYDIESDDFE